MEEEARKQAEIDKESFIENCRMIVECPMRFSQLQDIEGLDNTKERFCDKCEKIVYRTNNLETLKTLSRKGECVSFYIENKMLGRKIEPIAGDANRQRTGCWII